MPQSSPSEVILFGLSAKQVSLLALTLQNTALGVVMHHSRVSAPSGQGYFFPTAVLLTEVLKCAVSFFIAVSATDSNHSPALLPPSASASLRSSRSSRQAQSRVSFVLSQLTAPDYWKLAIPAILYVLQNNLQFVAVSNLEPPVFICAYQMKILTTAVFSILLLRKRLGLWQWLSLAMLAFGVAIVQLQSKSVSGLVPFEVQSHGYGHISAGPVADLPPPPPPPPFDAHGAPPPERFSPLASYHYDDTRPSRDNSIIPPSSPSFPGIRISMSMEESEHMDHGLQPLKGFIAVVAACFTSGLAGVYFEMVLKTSNTDLWTRNVQLSAWSIIPASVPVFLDAITNGFAAPFRYFGPSAWATVILQVTGGLAVAMVIKHADNILKGFAVSFSIILSFVISVAFFNFPMSFAFVIGAFLVILSTFSYARGSKATPRASALSNRSPLQLSHKLLHRQTSSSPSLEKVTVGDETYPASPLIEKLR